MGTYVQYGCGMCVPEGWINFDTSPTLRLQRLWLIGTLVPGPKFPASARYGDIIRGLPIVDGSADGVYCSHVLEHLALEDMRTVLANTLKMLKPGGVFRFVLPDLREIVNDYVNSREPDAAMTMIDRTGMGQHTRPKGIGGLVRNWFGNAGHRWMWDRESMMLEVVKAGFVNVRSAACHDSGDPMFDRAEAPERWIASVGMHCQRGA